MIHFLPLINHSNIFQLLMSNNLLFQNNQPFRNITMKFQMQFNDHFHFKLSKFYNIILNSGNDLVINKYLQDILLILIEFEDIFQILKTFAQQ